MNSDQLLEKIGEYLRPISSGIDQLKTAVAQIKTAVEALKAGQDDIREQLESLKVTKADKADVKRLEKKLDTKLEDHEGRIKQLEENQFSTHKN